jgi:organic radical activating enzyme
MSKPEAKLSLSEFSSRLTAQYGPAFCLAKWRHLTLYLQLGQGHSCYHPQPQVIPPSELKKDCSALHNTKQKVEQRRLMKAGERPKECSYCWNIEDLSSSNISDRHIKSYEESGGDFNEVEKVFQADPGEFVDPSYIEVSFSSLCNFKCLYCNPKVSSSWEAEIKKFGPYKGIHNDYAIREKVSPEDNLYVRSFFEWWPKISKKLKGLRITGGEPLLHNSLDQLFLQLLQSSSPDLTLMINSNLGVSHERVVQFCERVQELGSRKAFRDFKLFTSLESIGARAEFTRTGLVFSQFKENVETFLEKTDLNLSFMCTFNLTSATGFVDFLEYFYSLRQKYCTDRRRIFIDIPYLEYPRMFHFLLLGPEYAFYADRAVEYLSKRVGPEPYAFDSAELALIVRIRDLWKKGGLTAPEFSHYRKDLARFLSQVEVRRKLDFKRTFPELESFYGQIKQEANL